MIRGLREKLGLAPDGDDDQALADLRSPKTQMALAIGRVKTSGQVYGGTASPNAVNRRRAKNKRAATSRRTNRGSR